MTHCERDQNPEINIKQAQMFGATTAVATCSLFYFVYMECVLLKNERPQHLIQHKLTFRSLHKITVRSRSQPLSHNINILFPLFFFSRFLSKYPNPTTVRAPSKFVFQINYRYMIEHYCAFMPSHYTIHSALNKLYVLL